ncbi:MAG: hypothetical protein U1E45_06205 [Geminicoccaceae bacterium]
MGSYRAVIGDVADEALDRVRSLLTVPRGHWPRWTDSFLRGIEDRLERFGPDAAISMTERRRLDELEERARREAAT